MSDPQAPPAPTPGDADGLLAEFLGEPVVLDLRSAFVCLGTLVGLDAQFYQLRDADLHDFRDGNATREVYVFDAVRVGIRPNRARVLIRRDEVVAVSRIRDVATD